MPQVHMGWDNDPDLPPYGEPFGQPTMGGWGVLFGSSASWVGQGCLRRFGGRVEDEEEEEGEEKDGSALQRVEKMEETFYRGFLH